MVLISIITMIMLNVVVVAIVVVIVKQFTYKLHVFCAGFECVQCV